MTHCDALLHMTYTRAHTHYRLVWERPSPSVTPSLTNRLTTTPRGDMTINRPYHLQIHAYGTQHAVSLPVVRPGDCHDAWRVLQSHVTCGRIEKHVADKVCELLEIVEELKP
jgi:hypothetical protein